MDKMTNLFGEEYQRLEDAVENEPDLAQILDWDDQDICNFYDRNPNLTILTYAGMLGLTRSEVKQILMGEK